jgi:hypothetical protein
MTATIRIVPQAPKQPMPELAAFLRPFHAQFARSEGPHAPERYLTGLLTELPDKNCQTIAANIPGTSQQSLQGLLTATGITTTSTASASSGFSNCPANGTAS